ncbi:MAG: Mut7-C RNAse domain-containing protein [Deltaproteobacteria bacterium]|nr:Mut7-C RNAse domain-containing protein [Deltaproteobacteria bacterium]MBI3388825.1 Mut7-C RNAse domain-containing protein [Deltaproteobacteria bacterium]
MTEMMETAAPAVKFIADRMLGRLATWLRVLGIDTVYRPEWQDSALLRAAHAEGRVLLTRDRRVCRFSEKPPLLFIESDHFRAQLQQVLHTYAIDPYAGLLTRCVRCNLPLCGVAPDDVRSCVPEYVLATQTRFVRCPRCRRVYWGATHAAHIRAELQQLGFPPQAQS